MQTNSRILDDIAKVASGAVGAAFSARDEMRGRLRAELEKILSRLDVVPREEFEAVRAMAAKARDEQERMADRLAVLEARLEAAGQPPEAARPSGASSTGKRSQSMAKGNTGTAKTDSTSGVAAKPTATSRTRKPNQSASAAKGRESSSKKSSTKKASG